MSFFDKKNYPEWHRHQVELYWSLCRVTIRFWQRIEGKKSEWYFIGTSVFFAKNGTDPVKTAESDILSLDSPRNKLDDSLFTYRQVKPSQ